jgi:UDP:flavonoid glycosyltransferase YjiC (YdhE family)
VSEDRRTIVFLPEGAFGPTNNCVGIGAELQRRCHRVVFVVEESFAGTLEAKGFEEARMRLQPPAEVEEEPGQFWKDFIRDTAELRKPTIERLETFLKPTWTSTTTRSGCRSSGSGRGSRPTGSRPRSSRARSRRWSVTAPCVTGCG